MHRRSKASRGPQSLRGAKAMILGKDCSSVSQWKEMCSGKDDKWILDKTGNTFIVTFKEENKKYRLTRSSKISVVDEKHCYVTNCIDLCGGEGIQEASIGFLFDTEKNMSASMKIVQDTIMNFTLKSEWDTISRVEPGDSRFFDAFVDDDAWVNYDVHMEMKRAKDYEPRPPRTCVAACAGFVCGDELHALDEKIASSSKKKIKAAPILEHGYFLSDEDIKKGPEHCLARKISLKSIDYPIDWNGANTKEHRKRGGKLVPWAHRVDALIDKIFPENMRYKMLRPVVPPNSPSVGHDIFDWRDPDVEYHSFIAQESDAMMTTTYGHCFTWYRPVTHIPLSSTAPPTKDGKVLHSQVALVVLSKFCFTKTTRERILRVPLRRLFGSNPDNVALRSIWHNALAPPLDSAPSSMRVGCEFLHARSWNPKLTSGQIFREILSKSNTPSGKGSVAKAELEDAKILASLNAPQCRALIALVPSVKVDPAAPLKIRRKAATEALRMIRAGKANEFATRQRYDKISLTDILTLETQVDEYEWGGQTKWIGVMSKYPELFGSKASKKPKDRCKRSVFGTFHDNCMHKRPHKCSYKEHLWISRVFGHGSTTQMRRQSRTDKITIAGNDLLAENDGVWPRLLTYDDDEHLFKFQMLPVVWWLATQRRCTFLPENKSSSDSKVPSGTSSFGPFYVSSDKGVSSFASEKVARACYDALGDTGVDKVMFKDTFHGVKSIQKALSFQCRFQSILSAFAANSVMHKKSATQRLYARFLRYWPVPSDETKAKMGTGLRGLFAKQVEDGTNIICATARDMSRIITNISDFVRPRTLQCKSPIPRSDAPVSRVCRGVMPVALVSTFQSLLVDSKVLVMSDHKWKLTDTLEVIMSMMFPFKCKNSLPSYEPLMPESECLLEYLESPYNFCYGVFKKRMVKDGLMESDAGRAYKRGDRLVICDDDDARDVLSNIVVIDLDVGDVAGRGFDRSTASGRRRLNGNVVEKVVRWRRGLPVTECQVESEGYVGEALKMCRFQLLQSFADDLCGYRPMSGNSGTSCRFGWPSRGMAETFSSQKCFDDAMALPAVRTAISRLPRLKENLSLWEPLPRRFRMRLLRSFQVSYGIKIPTRYRSLVKEASRQASGIVASIVMSDEEGQGTSDFPNEILRRSDARYRYSRVDACDREDMVRWAFMDVLTSILKPFRLSLIGNKAGQNVSGAANDSGNYKQHIFEKLSEGKTPRLKMMLNVDRFIELNHIAPGSAEQLDRAFVKSFTETQMFRQFLASKVKLKRRNVFDAWCALKNSSVMLQYQQWKANGMGGHLGRLSKLAKGDDGINPRGGFFGKFKGHKWRERLFHIHSDKDNDHLLDNSLKVVQSFTSKESETDDDEADDEDDLSESGASTSIKEHYKVRRQMLRRKIEKVLAKFKNNPDSKGTFLKWYDIGRDERFRLLIEFVESMRDLCKYDEMCDVYRTDLKGVVHDDTNTMTFEKQTIFTWHVQVAGVCNTRLGDNVCDRDASQTLLSTDASQRHYLYKTADMDGDLRTHRVSWYQVAAWKPQDADDYTIAIQHDKIREGDMIAVVPQISDSLVRDCYICCNDDVMASGKPTDDDDSAGAAKVEENFLRSTLSSYYFNEENFEYVWSVDDEEEHVGDIFLSNRELKKIETMGIEANHTYAMASLYTRVKISGDVISFFPESRLTCTHSWKIDTYISPKRHQKNRPVFVVDYDDLVQEGGVPTRFPEAVLELYAMMADKERKGKDHCFKIVPGHLGLGLPSEEYQRRMVEKASAPYYFKLHYGGMEAPPDEMLMCTAFDNFSRRQWMKALKVTNYDTEKYEKQNAEYKASLDDDPATRALVEGGLTLSNALVIENKCLYESIKLYQKAKRGKIDVSRNAEGLFDRLEVLIRPSELGGFKSRLVWLKALAPHKMFAEFLDSLEAKTRSVAMTLAESGIVESTDTSRTLLEVVLDAYDMWLMKKKPEGVKFVMEAAEAIHGGSHGLNKLLSKTKSSLEESGIKFMKRRKR